MNASSSTSIRFLGASGTVTGSKFEITTTKSTVQVDCGLFQGYKQLRLRNWEPLPLPPARLNAILLTHAHLDHSGACPLWARHGYRGPIYATPATMDLCKALWLDSARLQEEDAEFANRHGYSKHQPALPLYTQKDAHQALELLTPVPWRQEVDVGPDVKATWYPAGHILGAASVLVRTPDRRIHFSGDLGRTDDPVMPPPDAPAACDTLVIESTYGDRDHHDVQVADELAKALMRCVKRSGAAVVPVFAVGRAQMMLLLISQLKAEGRLPSALPVYLDSPMAIDVTGMYQRHADEHRVSAADARLWSQQVRFCVTPDESKAIAAQHGPKVILAASGMATGGRVLHHLKRYLGSPKHTIVLAGHQVAGTRGAALANGAREIRIHGESWPVKARVITLRGTSAHADRRQLLDWAGRLPEPPQHTFVVHGESGPADALRFALDHGMGWPGVIVPEHGASYAL